MAPKRLTLQDVARAAADKNGGKGGRGLQRLADSKGLTLSYATVDRILAGKYESTPQRPTIEALAVLADMPLEEVYEAAGLPLPMASFADQLPDGVDQLTVDQRRVVLDVIRGFIRDNRKLRELEGERDNRPPKVDDLVKLVAEADFSAMDDEEFDLLYTYLVWVVPRPDDRSALYEALDQAAIESIHREAAIRKNLRAEGSGSVPVEGDAQPDGVTTDDDDLPPAERGGGLNAQISRAKSATSTRKDRTTK